MLPKMTTAKAIETKTKNYICSRKCNDCGSREKWLDGWANYKAYCATCIPETTGTTVSKSVVAATERKRNKVINRKIKNSVSPLPRVFNGMNTK